jgi:carbamoyltransferase
MPQKPLKILGLSFFYHDAAACLMIDGKVVAAVQEERFTRKKHDDSFPVKAIKYCLDFGNLLAKDIDYIIFYDKPVLKFERLLRTYIRTWPKGLRSFIMAMQIWLKDKLWVEQKIRKHLNYSGEMFFCEHHYSHAASAYYASDFDEAVVVTTDAVGEWDTTTFGYGRDNQLVLTHTIKFPDSLGMLYSALTYYLGFRVNSAEYKVMGLAPYGNPDVYYNKFKELIDIKEDGSFKLNMKYFAYEYGLTMTNSKFNKLFGGLPRKPESELTQRQKDIAAALQKVTEEVVLKMVKYAKKLHPSENLCLAGGVALNCVANGKILKEKIFKNIYIQPASGDAGGAVGAALYFYYECLKNKKQKGAMSSIYLGPEYSDEQIEEFLERDVKEIIGHKKVNYKKINEEDLTAEVAKLINGNNAIGWFQGKMEFGPRALGNRSIIADARNKENWQKVNLKIKFRENFRPFAPTILEEKSADYFDLNCSSPYMLLVAQVKKDNVPAVIHVDNSARIQTINKEQNERYYELLNEFYKSSGCPVIINTSFNVRGEPIVESPKNAFECFINTHMDYLVMGNYLISKKENIHLVDVDRLNSYLSKFKLD